MRVTYPGPSDAVDVVTDDETYTAVRGEPIDIPDEAAKGLVAQGWEPAATSDSGGITRSSTPKPKPSPEKTSTPAPAPVEKEGDQ